MKQYVDFVFKKEKKPIEMEKLFQRVEQLIQKEDSSYQMSEEDKQEIEEIVFRGVEKLEYYRTPSNRFTSLLKTSFRKGRFHGNRLGDGVVVSLISYTNREGKQIVKEEKYTVSKEDGAGAIDGDYVLVDIHRNGSSARVERILDRNVENITGEVVRVGNSFFVRPLDKKKQGLTIALEGQYIEGDIVSVSLVDQRSDNFYIGKIVREFKHKDDPHEDALLEAFKCGMPEGFSEESLKQLDTIPMSVSEEEKVGRYDFTSWEIFSIDGADTKDKDDCISYQLLPNGNVLLGVHIADTPHYVPTNSPIHKDAFRKGTSYYFGGCVEPQLPRKLSNGICSLNDGVDRLTKSILIEYDSYGNVVSRSLVPSVIRSSKGMTYDCVNQILKTGEVPAQYEPYEGTLKAMAQLSKKLRKRRINNGAIEFNRPEIKFLYDEDGKAIGVKHRVQDVSENLIEEFMLAANVNVGEILTENGIPCVYRVHDVPNIDRLTEFLRLLEAVGYPFDASAEDICSDKHLLQELADHVSKTGHLQTMLMTNLIRCLSHAGYSPNNIGHYGTGFEIYLHFTSPIRRLADDTISRIIDDCYFEKDPNKKQTAIKKWKVKVQEFASQASKMEKVEEQVEKNVHYMDTAVYLQSFVGQEFEGTIISLGNNGITIQLDNLLEGRIRTKSLPGKYAYNPETFTLLSLDGFDSYYVGDRLKMRLTATDKDSKTVDFVALEKVKENRIMDPHNTNQYVKSKAKDALYGRTY